MLVDHLKIELIYFLIEFFSFELTRDVLHLQQLQNELAENCVGKKRPNTIDIVRI